MFKPLAGEPDPFGPPPRGKPYNAELPLEQFGTESELAAGVLERLDPWFVIEQEVLGTHCTGRRLRVDAIIQPRERDQWRNPAVAFGIEFKLPRKETTDYTRWLAQASDYTHVEWDHHGRVIILTCPGAATWLDGDAQYPDRDPGTFTAKRLSGQLNVGELVLRWHNGLSILLKGEHVWSERAGVVRGREWFLNPGTGHR